MQERQTDKHTESFDYRKNEEKEPKKEEFLALIIKLAYCLAFLGFVFFFALVITGCSNPYGDIVLYEEEDGSGKTVDELTEDVQNSPFTIILSNALHDLWVSFHDELAEALTEGTVASQDAEYEKVQLVRVVDGDTIVVEINGKDKKVRLIGVNTPESVASEEYLERTGKENTQEGKDASEFTKNLLADTDYVYLVKDSSETDRYGRLLRYVWLSVPEDELDPGEVSEKMVNGILIWEGYAEPMAIAPDTKYQEVFEYLAAYREIE